MMKYISTIGTIALMSLFLFPIELKAFPGMNSKKFLAAVGLVWFFIYLGKYRTGRFSKDMVILSLLAGGVSMAGLIAVTYNETPDYVYATYISSMWVWLGAAYVVVNIIRLVHGSASIWLAGNYFIVVCVIQCVMALWIDSSVELKQAIDSVIEQGQDFLNSYKVERLYGIGASLDVAGSRFAGFFSAAYGTDSFSELDVFLFTGLCLHCGSRKHDSAYHYGRLAAGHSLSAL